MVANISEPRARLRFEPSLRLLLTDLLRFFRGRGVEAYLIGGSLRDALLGRLQHDIDLALAADPLTIGRQLADALEGHFFPIGQEQGVARVALPEGDIHIDLAPLRLDIESDLAQRDYTIDAMAVPLSAALSRQPVELIDPCRGRNDLKKRLVRMVSAEAFHQDPLRLLRGVRLCAELGSRLEPATAEAIQRNASRLSEAAPERQRDELRRILATPRAGSSLCLLDELGLLPLLIPELEATRGVEQPKEHHWDVFHHLLEAVAWLDVLLGEPEPRAGRRRIVWRELWDQLGWLDLPSYFRQEIGSGSSRSAILKLAALLHDIAKPQTKTFDRSGRMRFFGHAELGADIAESILRRFRFSSREVDMVRTMVAEHLRPVQLGQSAPDGPSRRALYRFFRDCGESAIAVLFLSLADHLATVGPRLNLDGWRAHVSLVNYMLAKRLEEEVIVSPPKLVSGHDLMAELALSPGPLVGQLLEAVREAQAAGEVSDRQQALAFARRELARLVAQPEPVEG